MYHAHFGLKKALFEPGIAQEAGVYLGPRQRAAIAAAKTALTPLDSAMLLTGAAGVGKTTLASAAVRAASTRVALGWLTSPPAHAAELLELLLVEFGLSSQRATRVERLQMWRQFLNEMSATESRVFVLVERCEDHSADALRALESLTAVDPNGGRGANLVLLGGADLALHLKSSALDALRQRIRLRQRVEPLDAAELQGYLAHHAALAGGSVDALLEPSAVAAVLRFSGGLPRVVNNLCETALDLAAAASQPRVDETLIRKVAVDLFGIEPEPPAVPADHEPAADAPPRSARNVVPIAPAAATPAAARPSAVWHTVGAAPVSIAPTLAVAQPVAPPVAAPVAMTVPVIVATAPSLEAPVAAAVTLTAAPAAAAVVAPGVAEPSVIPAPPTIALPTAAPAEPPDDTGESIVLEGDDSFATTTIVDEPEVPMAEFPVLTDAVDGTGRAAPPARLAAQAQALVTAAAAADLDIVSAALAASAWTDEDARDAPPEAGAARAADVIDDPFDLFDLGSDAPLELIDDTHTPSPNRPLHKSGERR